MSFQDYMIDDGFDNEMDYMDYLEKRWLDREDNYNYDHDYDYDYDDE